jgi:hypothetical protein
MVAIGGTCPFPIRATLAGASEETLAGREPELPFGRR